MARFRPSTIFVADYRRVTTATATIATRDRIIGVNFAGSVTLTLPRASNVRGRFIVNDESGLGGANNITTTPTGGETIDGSSSNVIDTNYGSRGYYSNGSNWFTI